MPHPTTILGLETTCDETAAAIVQHDTDGLHVFSNIVATQYELHEEYGGVVPEIASRAHLERIEPVIQKAMAPANTTPDQLDAISVANRPGLIGSLLVGVAAAKALAWAWNKPIIGVDHVEAHLHAASLDQQPPHYPALGLVVSGGHTSLFLVRSPLDITRLGHTIDDAIGEAYDKVATMLGLAYPGGPIVDQRATLGNPSTHKLPKATLKPGSLDFSFSGLKTAMLYLIRGNPQGRGKQTTFPRDHSSLTDNQINDLCASFQRAAVGVIMIKIDRAIKHLDNKGINIHSLIIGGGVSANSHLRTEASQYAKQNHLQLHQPDPTYCQDNAAMIAGLAAHRYESGSFDSLTLSPSPMSTI